MKNRVKFLAIATSLLILSGCAGNWSSANVEAPAGSTTATTEKARVAKTPSSVLVTKTDITDKAYDVLGDIEVTVNKTTIFHPDPTPELVDEKLREEAAELGADAVILVRYGSVGVSFFSWGSLDGRGRAVAFK